MLQCNAESAAIETSPGRAAAGRGTAQRDQPRPRQRGSEADRAASTRWSTPPRAPAGGFLSPAAPLMAPALAPAAHRAGGWPPAPCWALALGQRAGGVSGQGAGGVPAGYGSMWGPSCWALQSYAAALSAGGVLRWYMPGSCLCLCYWRPNGLSAACRCGHMGQGLLQAGGGAAPAGPAGMQAAVRSPQKRAAGQSTPQRKKEPQKNRKRTCQAQRRLLYNS